MKQSSDHNPKPIGPKEWRTIFSPEEMKSILRPSDLRGFAAVFTTWSLVAASFLVMGHYPHILTWTLGCLILGGRHLALAILMHEASHYSLFKTRKLNDWIGQWLCAYPTWQDLKRYRVLHLKHHQYNGGPQDPDLNLVRPFPITRSSFLRKFLRDALGLSGLKRIYGLILMDLGFIEYSTSGEVKRIAHTDRSPLTLLQLAIKNMGGVVLTNLIIWALLSWWGHGWLYLFWVLAYLSPFSIFVRIRSIAEHACPRDPRHPLLNTRSTQANVLARLTVAPHHVNYHLEHHLFMQAPYFQLPAIHKKLKEEGLLDDGKALTAKGYLEVLKQAIKGPRYHSTL